MAYPEVVFVTNLGPKEFDPVQIRDGKTQYELPIGIRKVIPFDCARAWFGHPFVRNIDDRNRPRNEERERMRNYWGAYGDATEEDMFPKVKVQLVEDDSEIFCVVTDPDGKNVTPGGGEHRSERDLINSLKDQLEALQKQVNLNTDVTVETGYEGIIDAKPEILEDEEELEDVVA